MADRCASGASERDSCSGQNEAASRLQEYLTGIREIKAHHMGGERFERLRLSFERLMRASIRLEGVVGPVMMGAMLLIRSGMTIMILAGSYLLAGGTLSLPVFLLFLLVGTRIFDPLTVVLMNYGEMRYSAHSAQRIMEVRQERPMEERAVSIRMGRLCSTRSPSVMMPASRSCATYPLRSSRIR